VVGLLVYPPEESFSDPFRRPSAEPRAFTGGIAVVHAAEDTRVSDFLHHLIRRRELVDWMEQARNAAVEDKVNFLGAIKLAQRLSQCSLRACMRRGIFRVIGRRHDRRPAWVRGRFRIAVFVGPRNRRTRPPEPVVIFRFETTQNRVGISHPQQRKQASVIRDALVVGDETPPIAWRVQRRWVGVELRKIRFFGRPQDASGRSQRLYFVQVIGVFLAGERGRSRCAEL